MFFLFVLASFFGLGLPNFIIADNGLNLKTKFLINHVEDSIKRAEIGYSKLTQKILDLDGMSSDRVRHLLNNLCEMKGASYLEIGVWKGSTFVSSLYKNALIQAISIDNFSEFGGPKKDFFINCSRYLKNQKFHFYDIDCFMVNLEKTFSHPINVYFYDGNHSVESHEQSLTYFEKIFDESFILIIDDWNSPSVQLGTTKGLKTLNYTLEYEISLPSKFNGDKELWWNGIYIAVLQKKKAN